MRARLVLVLALLTPLLAAAAAGAPSDGFEGALEAPWTILRESRSGWGVGSCPPDDPAGCYLTIFPARGDLVGATDDARNVFLQPVPDGDFRVTTQLAFFPTEEGQRAGLLLYQGDDDFFFLGVAETSERVAQALVEAGGLAASDDVPTDWSPVFLRYERVGEEVSAYASPDGVLWTAVGTRPAPAGSDLRMGVFAAKGHGPRADDTRAVLTADFGYFHVEAPPAGPTRVEPPTFTLEASPATGEAPFTTTLAGNASWDYPGLTWTLTFGDGSTPLTGEGLPMSVEHTYADEATYRPRLAIRNAYGALGLAEASVRVDAVAPVAPVEEEADAPRDGDAPDAEEDAPAEDGTTPGATVEERPPGEILVLDAAGEPLDRAAGVVRLRAEGAPGSEAATFALVDADGGRSPIPGEGEATWDTTGRDNGRYTVEARSGDVVLASREIVVENPRATVVQAAGAVAAGAATVGLMSFGASAFGGRFDLLSYLGDAAQNLGEDVARKRTAEVAALDRRRTYRSLVLAGVAMLLNAFMFAYAEVQPWDLLVFLAALPFFAAVALLYASTRYMSEREAARATGAAVHFRIWVPGTLSLIVSTFVFKAPFGYPGFLRKNEPVAGDAAQRRRAAGLRALASLGIYLAVTVPFAMAGLWWRYDFAEIGATMAFAAFGSAVLPFQPLPGGNVWRWNKPLSIALAVAGAALYFAYQLALLPMLGVLAVGLVGACAAVASAVVVRGAVRFAAEIEVNEDG